MPSRITVGIQVTNPECAYLSTRFSANWVGNGWRGVFDAFTIGCYCKGLTPSDLVEEALVEAGHGVAAAVVESCRIRADP
jgi:hypothetical protein